MISKPIEARRLLSILPVTFLVFVLAVFSMLTTVYVPRAEAGLLGGAIGGGVLGGIIGGRRGAAAGAVIGGIAGAAKARDRRDAAAYQQARQNTYQQSSAEKERLELEKERLRLERERLELEKRKSGSD